MREEESKSKNFYTKPFWQQPFLNTSFKTLRVEGRERKRRKDHT
jgi:hypothetical protein